MAASSDYSDPEMEEVEEEEDDEVEILSSPPLPPPANRDTASFPTPTAAVYRSACTPTTAKLTAARFKVPPEYGLRAPTADERAHCPPAGYATIYTDHFRNGLRLPLQPFVVSVLDHYRISLAQLMPNCIVPLLGFVSICRRLSITPTTTLLRYFYRLRKNSKDTEGWYTFNPRELKIVHGKSSSRKVWKSSFLFFKTAPVLMENPTFSWRWNYSPVSDPLLPEHQWPSEQTIDRFKANIVVRKSSAHPSKEKGSVVEKGITKAATEMQSKSTSTNVTNCKDPKTASTESLNATEMQSKSTISNVSKDPKTASTVSLDATEMQSKNTISNVSKDPKTASTVSLDATEMQSKNTISNVSKDPKTASAESQNKTEMQSKNTSTNVTNDPKTASTESLNAGCGQRKLKRVADVYETKPAKALKGPTGNKCVDGSSQIPSIPGLKDLTTDQFARFIQKSVRSFNLQLQGEKEELEKVVEAKEQNLKDMEIEISSLKGGKTELEKENASLQAGKKELEEENALLKAKVSALQVVKDDRGELLKVFTWKLLKTRGFSEFFYKLATSAKRLGRHEAAELMRDRYPDIPESAFVDLEDPLAAFKLDNMFYDMIQDDAFNFPLLNHLLSLEEVPSSSQLQDSIEDEDLDAFIVPTPL